MPTKLPEEFEKIMWDTVTCPICEGDGTVPYDAVLMPPLDSVCMPIICPFCDGESEVMLVDIFEGSMGDTDQLIEYHKEHAV